MLSRLSDARNMSPGNRSIRRLASRMAASGFIYNPPKLSIRLPLLLLFSNLHLSLAAWLSASSAMVQVTTLAGAPLGAAKSYICSMLDDSTREYICALAI